MYTTVRVDMQDAAAVVAVAERGARALRAGGLLVHPTSSLYGIGAAVSPDADRAIAHLKQRSPEKPMIRLAHSASVVRDLPGVAWDARCERLAADFWPGPLTLVLDDGTPHGLAVRVDGHPLVEATLDRFGGLMTSTSVNRASDPPARDPKEVQEVLERMPLPDRPLTFLDAGPLPDSEPSTVLGLRGGKIRVLRSGAVRVESIERSLGEAVTPQAESANEHPEPSARARLLFVCTGNTCRSPLAEAIARAEAERRGWTNIEVGSAGTFAYGGQPASATGIEVAAEGGLDLSAHRSTTLDFRQLSAADLVLGMTPEHKEAALHIHPAVRAHVITEYLPVEHPRHGDRVADPIGGGVEEYRQTYQVLESAIRGLFDQLAETLASGRKE